MFVNDTMDAAQVTVHYSDTILYDNNNNTNL